MREPYLRICAETREAAEAERRRRTKRANRVLLAFVVGAVFFAICLCVGLAARADSGTWRLPVDRVDCVEIGKVYTGDGDLSLTQLVWWHQEEHGYEVVDWRLLKPGMEPHKVGGWWVVTWIDNGRLVRVHARSCYQSWLQHDSELARREHWPLDQRRKVGGW